MERLATLGELVYCNDPKLDLVGGRYQKSKNVGVLISTLKWADADQTKLWRGAFFSVSSFQSKIEVEHAIGYVLVGDGTIKPFPLPRLLPVSD